MSRFTLAELYTGTYIQSQFNYSLSSYLLDNPRIKDLHLIPYSGNTQTDDLSATEMAQRLVAHMAGFKFNLEQGQSLDTLREEVKAILLEPDSKKAKDLSNAVDKAFVFPDEELS